MNAITHPANRGLDEFTPSGFTLVMATGIVSLASHDQGFEWVAMCLLGLNLIAFSALVILSLLRASLYTARVVSELSDHVQAVGYFAMVAATCVLGCQLWVIAESRWVPVVLWFVGVAAWFVFSYWVFAGLSVRRNKPKLEKAIHGGWLLSVVASQSIAVLGGLLASWAGAYSEIALFFSLAIWLSGGMLYVWIISLIVYRYLFFEMSAADLHPTYWINMGAMAISTLAGTILVSGSGSSPLLNQLQPFLKGMALLFWATATWWIPLLIVQGVWRHAVQRHGVKYDHRYWGLVFPLGMYAVCTRQLTVVLHLTFLDWIPDLFTWLALIAWGLTFAGLIGSLMGWNRVPYPSES